MRRITVLVLILGWVAFATAQSFTAGRIEVVGNAGVPTKDILAAVGFKAGQEVTREQVLAAVQAILDLGYFSEVTPELDFEGDLVVLRFKVVEFPKIERVVLEGIPPAPKGGKTLWAWIQAQLAGGPQVTESRIKEILAEQGIKSGQVLNRHKLEAGLKAVLEEYRKKDLATVQIGKILPGPELVIEIQELTVLGHRFRGLSTVPEEEARKLVAVPVGAVGKFSDMQASMSGFARSIYFAEANLLAEPGEGGIWLVWQLKERAILPVPASLRGIKLVGVSALPLEQIQARLGPLPPGQATNLDVLRALAPVNDYYRREGYFLTDFVAEGIAEGILRVRVKEGRLARVEVAAGTRTAPWVIERVMGLSQGQILTEARFSAARQALMALGYFSDAQLEPRWVGDDLVLTVTVTDIEKLGSIKGSVTYSPAEKGLVGNIEYAQKNILGTAQDLSLAFARGLVEAGSTTWSLSYVGRAFPVYDLVGLDLYRREEGEPRILTLGGRASLSYPLGHYLDLSLALTSERAWELPEEKELEPRTAVEVGIVYDDRDSPLFTRRGGRARSSVEQAGLFAPGVEYLTLRGELSRFHPVDLSLGGLDLRLALAGRVLTQWGWNVPDRYQFDLGGVNSVRGAKPVRTERLALMNGEVRVEVAQGAWVALFWDLGTELKSGGAVKSALGVELAAHILGMFVRLDLCWPSDRPPTWVPAFEFGMSPMF